jgi:pimeloyl-ACP methyl ester carboxylesterase
MALVDVPGARLWVEDSGGDGLPVVFMHPAAGTSASWVRQVETFTASGYRCITYDLRGWGQSVPTGDAATSSVMSDDVEALANALDLQRFVLIAAAYGGFGGLDFVLRFPDRLRAFVLATSQGGLSDPDYAAVLARVVTPEIRALPLHVRELGPSYRAEDPDGVERWRNLLNEGETHKRQSLTLPITLPMLETLNVPTLLLAAGADLLAPPALMRLIANRIPECAFDCIAEAGHSAHWERPAEWNRAVLDFLQRSVST